MIVPMIAMAIASAISPTNASMNFISFNNITYNCVKVKILSFNHNYLTSGTSQAF